MWDIRLWHASESEFIFVASLAQEIQIGLPTWFFLKFIKYKLESVIFQFPFSHFDTIIVAIYRHPKPHENHSHFDWSFIAEDGLNHATV